MDRNKSAAVNILRMGKENIFRRFILQHKKHRKYKGNKIIGTDCAEYMPVEELTNTFDKLVPEKRETPCLRVERMSLPPYYTRKMPLRLKQFKMP